MTRAELGQPQPITPERIAAEFPEAPYNIKAVDVFSKRTTQNDPQENPLDPFAVSGFLVGMAFIQHQGISFGLVLEAYKERPIDPEAAKFLRTNIQGFIKWHGREIKKTLELSKQFQEAEKEIREALAATTANYHGRPASSLLNHPHHIGKLVDILLKRRAGERNKKITESDPELTIRRTTDYASVLTQAGLIPPLEHVSGRKPETQKFYAALKAEWQKNPGASTQVYADALAGQFDTVTFSRVRSAIFRLRAEKESGIGRRRDTTDNNLARLRKIVATYRKEHGGEWPMAKEVEKKVGLKATQTRGLIRELKKQEEPTGQS